MKILKKRLLHIFIATSLLCLLGMNSFAQTTYDWLGTASSGLKTDWTNPLNWKSTTSGGVVTNPSADYPGHVGTTDIVDIGVNVSFYNAGNTPQPKINTGVTVNIASLNMGDNLPPVGSQHTINLTVNGALNITNAFTQMHSSVGTAGSANSTGITRPIQNYLNGSGTMTCGTFIMGDSTVPTADNVVNVTAFKMGSNGGSGSTLIITDNGDFIVNSPGRKDAGNNILSESFSEFSFAAGTLNIMGQIKVTEITAPYTTPVPSAVYSPLAWFSMDLFNNADSPVLNLFNANPIAIQTGSNRNSVDFYNVNAPGGTGTATVNYAGTGGTQDVPIYKNDGTLYSFIDHTPSLYQNVTFSGAGTKSVTPTSGTFSVAGNFTLAAGTETVNISTNTPALTIGGNFSSASGTTLIKSDAAALTIPGTVTNGGTFTHSGGAAVTVNGATTNSGTINQTSTGNFLFTGAFNNSGASSKFSQTGAATANFTNAATNDGTIIQNNATGILNFNNAFTNTLSGSLFTLAIGTSNFLNSYSNKGTFTQTGGTVNINQVGTAQSLVDNSTGGTTFSNVNVENGSSGVTMSGSGQFYVSALGVLTMSNATPLAANGLLTVSSDINGTGTIANIPTGCTISGNVTVQRYIPGGTSNSRGYRLLSSAVNAGTVGGNKVYSINYLLNSTYISGTGFPTTSNSKAGNPSLYLYRENLAPLYTTFLNSNYIGIANYSASPTYGMNDSYYPTANIPIGNGYLFYFRGGPTTSSPFVSGSIAQPAVLASSGALNQGNITVSDWYSPGTTTLGRTTASGDPAIEGFNLVGNPYPCSIDWNKADSLSAGAAIYAPHVTPYIYMLVPGGQAGSGNYAIYGRGGSGTSINGGTNIIPSGVGFFVIASSSGPAQLNFTEAAKVTSQPSGAGLFLAKLPVTARVSQKLDLQMKLDSINSDEMIVSFDSNAKATYNMMEDARYKTGSGKVSLFSLSSDRIPLAINQLPLALKGDTIKLKVGATASGNYTLNLKSVTGIPKIYDIWLKDAFTKDSVNMRTTAVYSFAINKSDSTTFGSNRFSLVLVQDPALTYQLLNFDATKTGNNNKQVLLTWKTKNEQNYTNFTVERSNDNGKTFEVVGGALSTGAGTYSLLDKDPLKGNNLYRLKQEDFNSTVTYSNVVEIEYNGSNNGPEGHLTFYPNPALNNIHLSFDPKGQGNTTYNVKVTNSSGMIVKYALITEPNWQANVSNLLIGTYLIQVTDKKDNSVVGQIKFVKL